MKDLFCPYCKQHFNGFPKQKWHNCPGAVEAKRQANIRYQQDYYHGTLEDLKRHEKPRLHHKKNKGDHYCRRCGQSTTNYFHCPTCLTYIAQNNSGMPSDCLGVELGAAWG